VNESTVDILYQLAECNEARDKDVSLLIEDMKQKAKEYEAKGEFETPLLSSIKDRFFLVILKIVFAEVLQIHIYFYTKWERIQLLFWYSFYYNASRAFLYSDRRLVKSNLSHPEQAVNTDKQINC